MYHHLFKHSKEHEAHQEERFKKTHKNKDQKRHTHRSPVEFRSTLIKSCTAFFAIQSVHFIKNSNLEPKKRLAYRLLTVS
jgi:hypothetical protein